MTGNDSDNPAAPARPAAPEAAAAPAAFRAPAMPGMGEPEAREIGTRDIGTRDPLAQRPEAIQPEAREPQVTGPGMQGPRVEEPEEEPEMAEIGMAELEVDDLEMDELEVEEFEPEEFEAGMSEMEETEDGESGTEERAAQPIMINAQYIKDLSLEAPNSPTVLTTARTEAPDITVSVDVQATGMGNSVFEVVLSTNAECKMDDSVAFVVELSYAGLFTLNVSEEHMKPVLLIECPRLLFPFARNIVSDMTRDAGFPPLMMNPLDFTAMYRDGVRNESGELEESDEADDIDEA